MQQSGHLPVVYLCIYAKVGLLNVEVSLTGAKCDKMPLLNIAAKVGATVCSNLLVLSVCPWDRLPFCLYPLVRHTGNTLEDNKVASVKMERVRDRVERGKKKEGNGWGSRGGIWGQNGRKSRKNRTGGWGVQLGKSAAVLLLEAIICSDMLWSVSLCTHTKTSAGGTVAYLPPASAYLT